MFCSNCGSANEDGAKFCQKCGHALGAEAPAAAAPASPPPDTRMRDTQIASTAGQTVTGKNPVLATVLSVLIPGVGQLYNGDNKKGLVMLAIAIVLGPFTSGIAWLAVLIWAAIDAYRVADGKGKTW